jgi:hypothetical protein
LLAAPGVSARIAGKLMNPSTASDQSPAAGGVREEQSYFLVLASGLATSALALLGVYLLDRYTDEFHIMGWYANYVLPVGAVIVGLVAACGYGIASWVSGIKITKRLLWLVVVFQIGSYFAAQYIEFKNLHLVHRSDGSPVGFVEYFDRSARSFAWKQKDGTSGEPLGAWGYFFRLLEIAGFVGGGLIVPAALWKVPYCQNCQRYMRTRQLGLVPASVPLKKIKKSDAAGQAAHEAEHQSAFDAGVKKVEAIQKLAADGKAADFQKELAGLAGVKKEALKLPRRFNLQLVQCRRCYAGALVTHMQVGQAQNIQQTEVNRTELNPEFVRSATEPPRTVG